MTCLFGTQSQNGKIFLTDYQSLRKNFKIIVVIITTKLYLSSIIINTNNKTMKIENVKQIIQELASENFEIYPESYPIEDNEFSYEAAENMQELAKGYWDNRDENEIERDSDLGITLEDHYYVWICEQAVESFEIEQD